MNSVTLGVSMLSTFEMSTCQSMTRKRVVETVEDLIEKIEEKRDMYSGHKKRLKLELDRWSVFQHSAKITGGECLLPLLDCQQSVIDILYEATNKMRSINLVLDRKFLRRTFTRERNKKITEDN